MQLFYNPEVQLNTTTGISGQEHIHLTRSLRKIVGDFVHVTDGVGNLYSAVIVSSSKRDTVIKAVEKIKSMQAVNGLTLLVAPTKNISRYEWMIEKSVELGVKAILPFYSNNSERKTIKRERLQGVATGAMKQSLQLFLPVVAEMCTYEQILTQVASFKHKFIAYMGEQSLQLSAIEVPDTDCCVLIGPEGGFSPEEVKLAEKNGFKSISLGQNRLRTETAGIFAAAWYYAK